jgi:hypothetical protein
MPTEEPVVLFLLVANALVLGGAGALLLSRKPSVAIFLTLLAPCVPAAMTANGLEGETEPGRMGGYVRVSLLMLSGGAGLVAWLRSRMQRREGLPAQYIVLAAFLAWALASTFRSAAPFYTFVRAATFGGVGCFMLGLHAWGADEDGLDRILNALLAFIVIWVVANVMMIFLWPARAWWWNAPHRLRGLKNNPNAMGSFCAVSYPVILWRYWRKREHARGEVLGLAMLAVATAAMQLMSGSRTSLLCAGFGVAVCLLAARRLKSCAGFVAVGVAAGAILIAIPPASLKRRVQDDSAVNLTGRPAIWRAGWYLVEERPLEGFGYDAEMKALEDPALQRTARVSFSVMARQSMHNGFLSILAGTGVIGLVMWLALLAIPFASVWRWEAGGRKALAISIMSMTLLTNLVESQITPAASLTAAAFWIAWAVAGRLGAGVRSGPASPLRTGTGMRTGGEVVT